MPPVRPPVRACREERVNQYPPVPRYPPFCRPIGGQPVIGTGARETAGDGEGAGQPDGIAGALFRFRGRTACGAFGRNAVPAQPEDLRLAGMAANLLISIGIVAKIAGGYCVGAGIVNPEVLSTHDL